MREGRSRFNDAVLLSRQERLRTAIRIMPNGVPFYFLPDMHLVPRNTHFEPFFGRASIDRIRSDSAFWPAAIFSARVRR